MKKQIEKLIKYIQSIEEIDLYGEEYYIGERLLTIMKQIKENDYNYGYNEFGGNNFENSCILHVLDNLKLLEWGTSIRFGWIDNKKRDIFDMLIKMLEKEPDILSFKIQDEEVSGMWHKFGDEEDFLENDIKYLNNLLIN